MKLVFAMALSVTLIGCSKPAEVKPAPVEPPKPQQQSSVQQVVETMAGYTDAKAGRRAQETIRKVSKQKNSDLEEAMSK